MGTRSSMPQLPWPQEADGRIIPVQAFSQPRKCGGCGYIHTTTKEEEEGNIYIIYRLKYP